MRMHVSNPLSITSSSHTGLGAPPYHAHNASNAIKSQLLAYASHRSAFPLSQHSAAKLTVHNNAPFPAPPS